MPARTSKAKPARKAATKPKARPAAARKTVKGRATLGEAKQWTAKRPAAVRRNADIPSACPVCGSKRLDVRKADGLAKGAVKLAASAVVPFVAVRPHPEIDCLACGWRSEATY